MTAGRVREETAVVAEADGIALAEVGALGPVSGRGASEGEGGGCVRVTVGRVCEETAVVGEADGVALAEVGALGPVSSTGHRKGRWRVRDGDGGTRLPGDCGCC